VALTFFQNELVTLAARTALACLFYNHLTCSKVSGNTTASRSDIGSNRQGHFDDEVSSTTGSSILASCACKPDDQDVSKEDQYSSNNLLEDTSHFLASLRAHASADLAVAEHLHAWSDATWLQSESVEVTTI